MWKDRIYTILFLLGLIIATVIVYFSYLAFQRWDILSFTFYHPNLVLAMKQQYASESAQLEQKFMTKKESIDDKLKEAVIEQLKR